jgi:hypothetical protein
MGETTYALVSGHTLAHFLQAIVVTVVDVTKRADLVTSWQPGVGGRAAIDNAVDFGKRRLERLWDRVREDLGSNSVHGVCAFLRLCVICLEARKMLVQELLDDAHQLLVVVPQVDDARPRCPYCLHVPMSVSNISVIVYRRQGRGSRLRTLRHVNVGSRKPVGREKRRVHVDIVLMGEDVLDSNPIYDSSHDQPPTESRTLPSAVSSASMFSFLR